MSQLVLLVYSLQLAWLLATSSKGQNLDVKKVRADVHARKSDDAMTNICTGINYYKYCKDIGVCKPGTHVMCMYYKGGQTSGPACQNGRIIEMSGALKRFIMDKFNTVRTGMSNGTIRGKNDVLLPKARTGLAELKWDKELALFAQVWANQCETLAEDTCRATETFSNPAQMVAVVRTFFERPTAGTDTSCIKHSVLTTAIDEFFKTWEQDVKHVTSEDIQKYNGIDTIDGEYRRNNFLTLVNGKTTHIGCGLSAYDNYEVTNEGYDQLFMELVCNLSSQLIEGEPVYDYEFENEKPIEENKSTEKANNDTTKDITKKTTETTEQRTSPLSTLPNDPTDNTTDISKVETTEQPTNPLTTSPNDPTDNTTDISKVETAEQPASPVTTSPNDQTDNTTDISKVETTEQPKQDDNSSSNQEGYGNGSERRPTVLILPIITVEDAPGDEYLKKLSLINENLRGYTKKVLSSKNLMRNTNKQAIQKPRTSKKGSVFTKVPTFHLSSQNHDSRRKDNLQENILLRKKLDALLKKVPRKDLLRLEEALKLLKRNRGRQVNQLNSLSPLLNLNVYNEVNCTNTEVPKFQSVDIRLKYNAPVRRIDGTDEDLLRVAKGVLKITDHGNETPLIDGDKIKYPENEYWSRRNKVPDNSIRNAEKDNKWTVNTVFGNIKDRNRPVEIESKFDSIPTMRKQIPIIHANENNEFGENYSHFQKQGYFNLYRNDKSINNYIKDTNVQEQTRKFLDVSKFVLDGSKSKRRLDLEKEIYNLKRKLQHLRQYIRRNDISEKDRSRLVVGPHARQTTKQLNDVENFYMPDRAHSVHEF